MKRLFIFLIFLMLGTLACRAQQDHRISIYLNAKQNGTVETSLDELFPEWQLSKMKNLCAVVSGHVLDKTSESGYKYLYQRRIYEAAKIDISKDSKEVIAKKITAMWLLSEQLKLVECNSLQFDVRNGNLLKYAVSSLFNEFIDDAIAWHIPLNKVDENDNRTLLDYVQYHVNKNKGNALEQQYQTYYKKLRSAGAKHLREVSKSYN